MDFANIMSKSTNNSISAVRIPHFAGAAVPDSNEIKQRCKSYIF